jgi:DNA-binding beta-propeller fold protein YncE
MKKLLAPCLMFLLAVLPGWATPWAIIVNYDLMTIQTVDLSVSPPVVYGPFLAGSLGTLGESLMDVAIAPSGNYALVCNFYGQKIYRIDLTDPRHPGFAGTISTTGLNPEDVAISPDGKFAVITDGNFSNKVGFINLTGFTFSLYALTTPSGTANAVAIANDSSTVIVCDGIFNRIIYGRINLTLTGLISENNLPTGSTPINVSITSPLQGVEDTVLVANYFGKSLNVYRITGPGVVVTGTTSAVTGFNHIPQSISISPNGEKVYTLNSSGSLSVKDTLSWLNINGPGNVTMGTDRVVNLNTNSNNTFFGTEALALFSNGKYAVAVSPSYPANTGRTSLINLSTFQAAMISGVRYDAVGVAILQTVLPPLNCALERRTNNLIFYKEYVNRLTWQANALNRTTIIKYRIYRKTKGDPDTSYALYQEVPASATLMYDDRGLLGNQQYAYRMTAVNSLDEESEWGNEIGN